MKKVFPVLLLLYFLYYAYTPTAYHFIDIINLIFHEAGHTLTFFFGQFISIASGSLFQILIPLVCVLYFYVQDQKYSASLLLFWVGQNFINVSVYARDAILMQIPLLGGDSVIHDWNYLLSTLHILKFTPYVANTLFSIGILLFIFATYFSILNSEK